LHLKILITMFEELEKLLELYNFRINALEKRIEKLEKNIIHSEKLAYTVKEASKALGVKETTIRSWISEQKLIAIQSGKILLIPAESLLALIKFRE
jgi:excisionase family DNA binding protein